MLDRITSMLLARSIHAVLIGSVAGIGVLQAQDTSKLIYDVSTVKAHDPVDQSMSLGAQNGDFAAINVELKNLIAGAWGVRPAWAEDQHWDLTGQTEDYCE